MITSDQIKELQVAVGAYCWHHSFEDFRAATGWTGDYALSKWRNLQVLEAALDAFDPETLAAILNSPRP